MSESFYSEDRLDRFVDSKWFKPIMWASVIIPAISVAIICIENPNNDFIQGNILIFQSIHEALHDITWYNEILLILGITGFMFLIMLIHFDGDVRVP